MAARFLARSCLFCFNKCFKSLASQKITITQQCLKIQLKKNMFAMSNNLKITLYNLNRIYTKTILNHAEKFTLKQLLNFTFGTEGATFHSLMTLQIFVSYFFSLSYSDFFLPIRFKWRGIFIAALDRTQWHTHSHSHTHSHTRGRTPL